MEIASKEIVNFHIHFFNDQFLTTKSGELYNLDLKLLKDFKKEISYIHENCLGFFDGSIYDKNSN